MLLLKWKKEEVKQFSLEQIPQVSRKGDEQEFVVKWKKEEVKPFSLEQIHQVSRKEDERELPVLLLVEFVRFLE